MKLCTSCGLEKSLDRFATRINAKDGLQGKCRECQQTYRRLHYEANRQKYIDKAKVWNTANRDANYQYVADYFNSHPCVDCGETDLEVLEFDHRGDVPKEFDICAQIFSKTWTQLLREIEKCDVRCANCHKRRTNRQFSFWRLRYANADSLNGS